MMEHHYISLGLNCAPAMAMNSINVRKKSYPFDWLLNFQGIDFITKMIQTDFNGVEESSKYDICFCKGKKKKRVYNILYPEVFHIHTDPMINQKENQTFSRRCKHFRATLENNSTIHFIVSSIRITKIDSSTTLEYFYNELKELVTAIKFKYPECFKLMSLTFVICSYHSYPKNKFLYFQRKMKTETGLEKFNFSRCISYKKKNNINKFKWRWSWYRILIFETYMTKSMQRNAILWILKNPITLFFSKVMRSFLPGST